MNLAGGAFRGRNKLPPRNSWGGSSVARFKSLGLLHKMPLLYATWQPARCEIAPPTPGVREPQVFAGLDASPCPGKMGCERLMFLSAGRCLATLALAWQAASAIKLV